MIKIKSLLEGKNDYKIYHNTFSSVIDEVRNFVKKNGYDIDEDSWWNEMNFKQHRARPKIGQTNRFSVNLTKNGNPVKKMVAFQVYGLESENYELNMYIT